MRVGARCRATLNPAGALGCNEQREKLLVADARRRAGHLRPQAARRTCARARAGRQVDLPRRSRKPPHRGRLVGGDRARVPRDGRRRRRRLRPPSPRSWPRRRSRTTSVPAARSPSRWLLRVDEDRDRTDARRRTGGSRSRACVFRIALVTKPTGSPPERTTRRRFIRFPGVRPEASTSNADVVGRDDDERHERAERGRDAAVPGAAERVDASEHDPRARAGSATWIVRSTRAETNREPAPASVSSSSTPSGVAIVTVSSSRLSSSDRISLNLDAFVRERSTLWSELEQLVRAAGQRPGAPRTGACSPARHASTAARPPTSPSRGARFPASRSSSGWRASSRRARALVYDAPARRGSLRDFLAVGLLAAARGAPRAAADRGRAALRAVAPRRRVGALRPGAAASLVPGDYSAVTEPRPAGPGPRAQRRPRRRPSRPRSSRTTSASRSSRSPAGILGGIGTAAVLHPQRRAPGSRLRPRDRRRQRAAVLRAGHGARRARAVVHRRRGRGRAAARLGARRAGTPDARASRCEREARPALAVVARNGAVARRRRPRRGLRHTRRHRASRPSLLVGFGLGAIFWGLVLWRGTRPEPEPSPADRR